VSEYARDAKSRLSESVRSASSSASETLSAMSEGAAEGLQKGTEAARVTTSALRQRAAETNRRAVALVRDQPLALVGLGLAAGSILEAMLPSTDTEDQLMGDASDELKASGAEIAEQQVDNLKTAAGGASGNAAAPDSSKDKTTRAGSSAGRPKQSRDTLESSTSVPSEGEPVSVAGNMTDAGPGRS
jgi:ElaB/YqjD/DUF883 family membrane-anchored ribosome-binding protein